MTRLISRLNIGGPAIQAISLTRLLEPHGFHTRLLRGRESPAEGSFDDLAGELGVEPVLVSTMRRELGWRDLPALVRILAHLCWWGPQVLHTHAAKAGTLGRVAALVSPRRPRVVIHTFHGHSLEGYFSSRRARLFVATERFLARHTTRIVAVSPEIRDDLVRLGVAGREDIEVIPLGFDLSPFLSDNGRPRQRDEVRRRWGVPADAPVVTLIARLVPIKRVDRFMRIATRLARVRPALRFVIVGDGDLREELMAEVPEQLRPRLTWAGFERDVAAVCFASDVVALTSDNEGTPVSLIEAQAAATPVVSTRVGGAATVVRHEETGLLVDREDEEGFARAVLLLLDHPAWARQLAIAGRAHARRSFSISRLVADICALYERTLNEANAR